MIGLKARIALASCKMPCSRTSNDAPILDIEIVEIRIPLFTRSQIPRIVRLGRATGFHPFDLLSGLPVRELTDAEQMQTGTARDGER